MKVQSPYTSQATSRRRLAASNAATPRSATVDAATYVHIAAPLDACGTGACRGGGKERPIQVQTQYGESGQSSSTKLTGRASQ
eukprot:1255865-Pleurochrysis_carterae.AAC.1